MLLKEVVDNCIDEYIMGYGKQIDITIEEQRSCTVRDYGRGIPLGKVVDVCRKINTGASTTARPSRKPWASTAWVPRR